MDLFFQLLVNSIIAGGIYTLVAIGYTMVYGVLKFINFAHGDLAMVGAYITYFLIQYVGLPILPSIGIAVITVAALGILIEKIAYKPLRDAPRLAPLITAIAVSIFLQSAVMLLFGARTKTLRIVSAKGLLFLGAYITPIQIVIVLTSILLMILLNLYLKNAKLGKAMRATADEMTIASVVGIQVDRVISYVFGIGSSLAAVAGILIAFETNLNPVMGFILGIKAFAAAVVGGIGSIRGAMVGGFIIGFAENFGIWYIPTGYKNSVAFVILVLVLLLRPSGIFGIKPEEEFKQ
ncbi:MAG: branched-chain amino acid ABC transporter permease [Desulfobacterales bacterium]|nr:MAG: branched-chain amino acid ABC transporter permease [Desulfobacterales bacterium]